MGCRCVGVDKTCFRELIFWIPTQKSIAKTSSPSVCNFHWIISCWIIQVAYANKHCVLIKWYYLFCESKSILDSTLPFFVFWRVIFRETVQFFFLCVKKFKVVGMKKIRIGPQDSPRRTEMGDPASSVIILHQFPRTKTALGMD